MLKRFIFSLLLLTVGFSLQGQKRINGTPTLQKEWKENPGKVVNVAVQGNRNKIEQAVVGEWHYKYKVSDWHYVRLSLSDLKKLLQERIITQVYYPYEVPQVLADTMRNLTSTDQVHLGLGGLQVPYTGKDVVIGVIDTGIDFNHEDFKNVDGTSRVLYYWDHSLGFDAQRTPGKYGYGQVWDQSDIDAGNCTSMDNSAHGSTVAGAAAGNGRATGFGKGVAPDADLIIVESDFGLSNWSLTIADAVDFIFSMADTLGKPAVVNASLGSYLGSHDGLDPAALVIDSLLNDQNGRLFVCAGGNSGNERHYHVNGQVLSDTSFTWLRNNPSSAFSGDAIYFDMWADTVDFYQAQFAMGAESRDPYYRRDQSTYYTMHDFLSVGVIEDTLRNSNGDQIGTIEWYGSIVDERFHLELLLRPDSTSYYYSFRTEGTGNYQMWSGSFLGLNDFPVHPDSLPSSAEFPEIQYYQYPDDESSIVSSWACSPHTITVANYQNRKSYIDVNGVPFIATNTALDLTPTSSKGPTRSGYLKPDVAAPGDLVMSAAPLWIIPSLMSQSPSALMQGGMHMRNGGTSMASPVVAGIAALYLERCSNASTQNFKDDLLDGCFDDQYTGITPDLRWGHGKVNAFNTLQQDTIATTILSDTAICDGVPADVTLTQTGSAVLWSNGMTSNTIQIVSADTIWASVYNTKSCKSFTDTVIIKEGNSPDPATISLLSNGVFASPAYNYEWYVDGDFDPNYSGQFIIPTYSGTLEAILFDEAGCSALSNTLYVDYTSIKDNDTMELMSFPNPVSSNLYILLNQGTFESIEVVDIQGKRVTKNVPAQQSNGMVKLNFESLASGTYIVTIFTTNDQRQTKVVKR